MVAAAQTTSRLWQASQSAKQVSTQATLQTISARIASEPQTERTQDRLEEIVATTHGGVDGWGQSILVEICDDEAGGTVYLLLSKGSDNELDYDFAQNYCDVQERRSILGEHPRDIVFKNGNPLQGAGK